MSGGSGAAAGSGAGRCEACCPCRRCSLGACVPERQSGAGDDLSGLGTVASCTPIRFGIFPVYVPRAAFPCRIPGRRGRFMARTRKKPVPVPAGEGVEVTDAPVQVVDRAAAIDGAKGSGMVCTRLPRDTRAGRRTQPAWAATATFPAVVALMDHLRSQGIQRLVLQSTPDYFRIWYYLAEAAGLEVWLGDTPAGIDPARPP